MGLRFSRRITIFPGVRVNLGLGGGSLSIGPRRASLNIGPRGTYANVGLPGTGLSWRERLLPPGPAPELSSNTPLEDSYSLPAPDEVPPLLSPACRAAADYLGWDTDELGENEIRMLRLACLLADRERGAYDWPALTDPGPPPDDEEEADAYARRFAVGRLARRVIEHDVHAWAEVLHTELSDEDLPFPISFDFILEPTGEVRLNVELPGEEVLGGLPLKKSKRGWWYENLCCNVLLRLAHEVYRVLPAAADDLYILGYRDAIDPATGHPRREVLLRLATDRSALLSLNLDNVEAPAAFEHLGGASKKVRGTLVPLAFEAIEKPPQT